MTEDEKKNEHTTVDDDSENYRDIAELMTIMGYTMNHSSARNYVIRIMKKFAIALTKKRGIDVDEKRVVEIAKSPIFQYGIADVLHIIEGGRKNIQEFVKRRGNK